MQYFDAAATAAALPFPALLEAIEALFVQGCTVPPRHVHQLGPQEAPTGTTLIMPAWQERYLGIKTVNIFPANAQQGLPGLFSTYLLYDAATGRPLAQIDGNEITSRRTAAASALAARYLARRDSRRLLVVGAGRVASLLGPAYASVFADLDILVWSRDPAAAQALAGTLRSAGHAARACASLQEGVEGADIVSCATLSTRPLINGAWLGDGTHLDLIGGFTPQMVEADDACFAGARVFVDTPEALQKAGDLLGPMARGVFAASDIGGDLAALCRGQADGRRSCAERTVFKSVGTALEDLAAAMLVMASATPAG